jgi:hypothetical protein
VNVIAIETAAIHEALAAMDADALRETIRDLLPWLDERNHARLVNALLERAVHGSARWRPAQPSEADVSDSCAFAEKARRADDGNPRRVSTVPRVQGGACTPWMVPGLTPGLHEIARSTSNARAPVAQPTGASGYTPW